MLLEQAQAGDTIITLEVSRLARSTKQLCEIIERNQSETHELSQCTLTKLICF
ncbi:MAG: recombinase family protein [Oscillospiraceae bacterium]